MAKVVHKFGRNDTVGNGVWEDVWMRGGVYAWPQAGNILHLFSAATGDSSTNEGARTVTLQGLATDFTEIQETVTLLGASTAVTTTKFQRINRAFVQDAGTYGTLTAGGNLGVITINTSGGVAAATIDTDTGSGTVGMGQTQVARYTVPKDMTAYVTQIELNVNAAKPADVAWFQRQKADVVVAPMTAPRLVEYYDGVDGQRLIQHHDTPYGPFPEKTDIWFAAKGDGNATKVTADFEIVLYPQGQEPEFG